MRQAARRRRARVAEVLEQLLDHVEDERRVRPDRRRGAGRRRRRRRRARASRRRGRLPPGPAHASTRSVQLGDRGGGGELRRPGRASDGSPERRRGRARTRTTPQQCDDEGRHRVDVRAPSGRSFTRSSPSRSATREQLVEGEPHVAGARWPGRAPRRHGNADRPVRRGRSARRAAASSASMPMPTSVPVQRSARTIAVRRATRGTRGSVSRRRRRRRGRAGRERAVAPELGEERPLGVDAPARRARARCAPSSAAQARVVRAALDRQRRLAHLGQHHVDGEPLGDVVGQPEPVEGGRRPPRWRRARRPWRGGSACCPAGSRSGGRAGGARARPGGGASRWPPRRRRGRSAERGARPSASRGSPRSGTAASTRPGTATDGRSLALCTARSARPSSTAACTSLANTPLPPSSQIGTSRRRSPCVSTTTSSTSTPGRRRAAARRRARPASAPAGCRGVAARSVRARAGRGVRRTAVAARSRVEAGRGGAATSRSPRGDAGGVLEGGPAGRGAACRRCRG